MVPILGLLWLHALPLGIGLDRVENIAGYAQGKLGNRFSWFRRFSVGCTTSAFAAAPLPITATSPPPGHQPDPAPWPVSPVRE